jgi:hypothetical protein
MQGFRNPPSIHPGLLYRAFSFDLVATYKARWWTSHEESGSPSDLHYYFNKAGNVVHITM